MVRKTERYVDALPCRRAHFALVDPVACEIDVKISGAMKIIINNRNKVSFSGSLSISNGTSY